MELCLQLIINPEELYLQSLQIQSFTIVSRVMPGKKDFVTIKASGTETHGQKRLLSLLVV
jgi:hypothetical protein